MIDNLEANKWIDEQTQAIIIETVTLHKTSGIYTSHFTIMEFVLDDFFFSSYAFFLSPIFATNAQIGNLT
jgi:hypothetical protein